VRAAKEAKQSPPPPGVQWAPLFDVHYMGHCVERLRTHAEEASIGAYPDDHITIRKELLAPLDAYMSQLGQPARGGQYEECRAAQALFDVGERLAEHFADRFPFDISSAEAWAARLRSAWVDFIATCAGPLIAHGVPARSAAASKSAKHLRVAPALTSAEVAAFFKGKTGKHSSLVGDLAAREDVSTRTVERRYAQARKEGLLP
jgi:hypothetical protein